MAAAPAHFWIEAFNVSNQEELFQANVGYWPFLWCMSMSSLAGLSLQECTGENQQANGMMSCIFGLVFLYG